MLTTAFIEDEQLRTVATVVANAPGLTPHRATGPLSKSSGRMSSSNPLPLAAEIGARGQLSRHERHMARCRTHSDAPVHVGAHRLARHAPGGGPA